MVTRSPKIILSLLFIVYAIFIMTPSVLQAATPPSQTTGEKIYVDRARGSNGLNTYLVIYPENEFWFLSEFREDGEGHQDRIMTERTRDHRVIEKRLQAFRRRLKNLELESPAQIQEQNRQRRTSKPPLKFTQQVWLTQETWSWDWERKFSDWVNTSGTRSFLFDHGIATDCADVAIAYRWIFARMNGLPAGNTLAGSQTLFTNESMRSQWQRLPTAVDWWNDQLFRTALDFVLDNTYTHSLFRDSYPIEIRPESFSTGVHHLDLYSTTTGHTMLVNNLDTRPGARDVLKLIYSDVPRARRQLAQTPYYRSTQFAKNGGGFLRARWPVLTPQGWQLASGPTHPGYSTEQYEPELMRGYHYFSDAIEAHLNPNSQIVGRFQSLLEDIEQRMIARKDIVEQGFEACQRISCEPESSSWDQWSTPSRDRAIRMRIEYALNTLKTFDGQFSQLTQLWLDFLNHRISIAGDEMTFRILTEKMYNEEASSDPRDTIKQRWGFKNSFEPDVAKSF